MDLLISCLHSLYRSCSFSTAIISDICSFQNKTPLFYLACYLKWHGEVTGETRILYWSCNLPRLHLYRMLCGHIWENTPWLLKSVISPGSWEKSYLKTATDGSAGIKWHLRMAAFGWVPTRCFWSLCASICVWQDISVCTGLHMYTFTHSLI